MTSFGQLTLSKNHVLCQGTKRFALSERLRELCCLLGQGSVYEQASETLEELLRLDLSGMQIQRVCMHYGSLVGPLVSADAEGAIPSLEITDEQAPTYVMMDGMMLPTREEKSWKEIKLGRIFQHQDVVQLSAKRRQIRQSVYVSHFGSVDQFFPKLERHLVPYQKKVILGDGAPWIWRWAEDNFPGARQILDFYHAKEKLVLFAKHQFRVDEKRKAWVAGQCEVLSANRVHEVVDNVSCLRARNHEAREAKAKLLSYYEEHEDRMQYKTYRDEGLLIGSGPVEAAHRSVLQQRLKLSGQRWTVDGAQAIADLRCYRKSGAWSTIQQLVAAA
ncbi:UPF0236 family transposase-like protein [Phaeodactylibacter xiamenensis]|uniref:UPF0236 family transposase-like protein n=1 Tax=Phaeodactylibacter xiamenensis TaxID=1524460 RepID=UPI0009DE9557|nr:UPF0236 family protein [Phaeodactylibacter xiamenensis]